MTYTNELLAPYTLADAKGSSARDRVKFSARAREMMASTPLPQRDHKLAAVWEGLPLPDGEKSGQRRWLALINDALPDLWEVIALTEAGGLTSNRRSIDHESWSIFWRPTKTALPSDSFQEMLRNIGRAKLYDLSRSGDRPLVAEIAGWMGKRPCPADVERTYAAFNDFARVAPFLKEVEFPTQGEIACRLRESQVREQRVFAGQLTLL